MGQKSNLLSYNYSLGTQTIGASYQFTNESKLVETAKAILEMGSNLIKINEETGHDVDVVAQMPFYYIFLWVRSSSRDWVHGMSEAAKQKEYVEMYRYTKHLLTTYNQSCKTFFLGHWEGDWYLLPDYDANKDAAPIATKGMIDWLTIRQQAVDDAKRDTPHSEVNVYHYTEVNRVRDAFVGGRHRLVNKVLPYVNVDFVSYSAYDIQGLSQGEVNQTLDYVQGQIRPKPGLPTKRVFIGEFGYSALSLEYDEAEHQRKNVEAIVKFAAWGAPFILYWAMYNNEVTDGQQAGFWLIDNKNRKWPLYDVFSKLYKAGREFVTVQAQSKGAPPTQEAYLGWMEKELSSTQVEQRLS